eukprot:30980-Pelagococcus_subviridis.AAC.27
MCSSSSRRLDLRSYRAPSSSLHDLELYSVRGRVVVRVVIHDVRVRELQVVKVDVRPDVVVAAKQRAGVPRPDVHLHEHPGGHLEHPQRVLRGVRAHV